MSCLAGHASTADTLTFARRYPIHIFTESAGGLIQFVAYSRGAISGEAVVEVNFLPYFDESTQAACQAGTLCSARYNLMARTITPLVGLDEAAVQSQLAASSNGSGPGSPPGAATTSRWR